jgi:hypothetical protein
MKSVNWCSEHIALDVNPQEKIQWCYVWWTWRPRHWTVSADPLCAVVSLSLGDWFCLKKTIPHKARVPSQSPFQKQLTEKRKYGRLCHLLAGRKNFQIFTMICRNPDVASSICLRATIFQNSEGTLWTHCKIVHYYPLLSVKSIAHCCRSLFGCKMVIGT